MDFFTGTARNEPAEEYHSKSKKAYISSTPIVQMAKSPLHFHEAWTKPVEPIDAMDKGSFIHSLLLEQDIEKYAARPVKDGRLVALNTKEYAAWLAQNQGKTPIHPDLYNEALSILTAACANKTFLRAFEASDKEVSFYAKHKATGLPIKARPDMICKHHDFILDVKSTSDIMKFERQLFSLAYDVRLIHYVETIQSVTGVRVPEIYFFAIESKAPYASKMFKLSQSATEAATAQWTQWMNEISACHSDDIWPGFSEEIISVDRPAYLELETVSFE